MTPREFRAAFFFCGLGAGALGFVRALGKLGADGARFVSVGAFDNDPLACQDFEYLTGAKATVADLSTITPAEIRAVIGESAPDCIFMSSPCKGLSSLLSSKQANSEKYQAMNRLVLTGIFLACETWKKPPGLLVLENVPRIRTRGKHLLIQAKALLQRYGYVFHEQTHELGEVGGLGQIRRRYLLVARQPEVVPAYVYRPPRQRVKACGEVLTQLPIPGDPAAGPMHALPRISWLNWLRLALIPAGGDWRDLPRAAAPDGDPHAGAFGVTGWKEPSATVVGESYPSNGSASVADARVPEEAFGNVDRVTPWADPVGTITAAPAPSSGGAAVADPRLPVADRAGRFTNQYRVKGWDAPAGTVTGDTDVQEGAPLVADPRVPLASGPGAHTNIMAVASYDEPTRTVTGAIRPGAGALSVADPRIPLAASRDHDRPGTMGVGKWEEPAAAVTGSMRVSGSNTPASVADPRLDVLTSPVPDGAERRSVFARHDVRSWDQPARTVAGSGTNGGVAVADPRAAELALAVAMKAGDGWSEDKPGLMGVNDWEKPTRAVVGRASVSGGNGVAAVADPRAVALPELWRGHLGVIDWRKPAPTVRSAQRVSQGAVAIADPRIPGGNDGRSVERGEVGREILGEGGEDRDLLALERSGAPEDGLRLRGPEACRDAKGDQGSQAGVGTSGRSDPAGQGAPSRLRQPDLCSPRSEARASRDARREHGGDGASRSIGSRMEKAEHETQRRAGAGDLPVDGAGSPSSGEVRRIDANGLRHQKGTDADGGHADALDIGLTCKPRAGVYGVLDYRQAAHAITGNARIDNGSFAIADPRFPEITDPKKDKPDFTPVIIAEDGTWHRPLTTLELAALQGLPATVGSAPLQLAGRAVGKWRERIGNAVPVQAATAIAETLLKALLAAALGTWTLGSTGIWVRDDGVTEDDAEELSAEGAAA